MHQIEIVLKQILFAFKNCVELVQSILHNTVIAIVYYVLIDAWLSDSINISKCFGCTFHHQVQQQAFIFNITVFRRVASHLLLNEGFEFAKVTADCPQ